MWIRLLLFLILLSSPGCATFVLYGSTRSLTYERSELTREVVPSVVVAEVHGGSAPFYCVRASYPDGHEVTYDVSVPDSWHVQTFHSPGVWPHDLSHDPGRMLDAAQLSYAGCILDIRGSLGEVSLELPDRSEYRVVPAPASAHVLKFLLHFLYPVAIAADAITFPPQVLVFALNPPSLF